MFAYKCVNDFQLESMSTNKLQKCFSFNISSKLNASLEIVALKLTNSNKYTCLCLMLTHTFDLLSCNELKEWTWAKQNIAVFQLNITVVNGYNTITALLWGKFGASHPTKENLSILLHWSALAPLRSGTNESFLHSTKVHIVYSNFTLHFIYYHLIITQQSPHLILVVADASAALCAEITKCIQYSAASFVLIYQKAWSMPEIAVCHSHYKPICNSLHFLLQLHHQHSSKHN